MIPRPALVFTLSTTKINRPLWCPSLCFPHRLKGSHILTSLNTLDGVEGDNPRWEMIMIRSFHFSATVITPKCCCDSCIDSPRYSSSNHLCASRELQQLNSLQDVNKASSGAIFRRPACAAKGHKKGIWHNLGYFCVRSLFFFIQFYIWKLAIFYYIMKYNHKICYIRDNYCTSLRNIPAASWSLCIFCLQLSQNNSKRGGDARVCRILFGGQTNDHRDDKRQRLRYFRLSRRSPDAWSSITDGLEMLIRSEMGLLLPNLRSAIRVCVTSSAFIVWTHCSMCTCCYNHIQGLFMHH